MVRDLSVSKIMALGRSLTGKEAALLIIDYDLRERDTGKSYKSEINALTSSIKYAKDYKQRNECIFYYELWKDVGFYSLDLQTCLMDIEINAWKLVAFQMLITESAIKLEISKSVNRLPGFLTSEEFESLYEECKSDRFDEIIPLEALADHEAFHKLIVEGLINKEACFGIDDVFTDNKSLEKKWNEYKNLLLKEYELGISNNELVEGKVSEKGGWYHAGEKYLGQIGITGKSWYHYDKKIDKGFNKSIDDKERLVDFYHGGFAIANGSAAYKRENSEQCSGEEDRQWIKNVLREGNCLTEKLGVITLDKDIQAGMEFIVERINNRIKEARGYQEVISRLQKNVFGDAIKLGDITVDRISSTIDTAAKPLLQTKEQLLNLFRPFSFVKEARLQGFENIDINKTPEPDIKTVEEQYQWLIDLAEKESGFRWHE